MGARSSNTVDHKAIELTLRDAAMRYPETSEDFPWGHRAMKVRGKAFLFLALEAETFSLSLKLPHSRYQALMLPFASPTGYGLGKSGWVTCKFAPGDEIPFELLQEWLDESYRAIAPKKLVAKLASPSGDPG
ncbi:MAG: MmcQ/YjbR family DNA-binding protein [Thermoanaerobaculia bacterium]